MKKRKTWKTSMNNIPTMNIGGIVITGDEVRMAMNTNIFIGERIIAFTRDFTCFKEEIARSLYLYDRKPELIGGFGLGELGNTVFELFDHVLSTEEKLEHVKAFTSK